MLSGANVPSAPANTYIAEEPVEQSMSPVPFWASSTRAVSINFETFNTNVALESTGRNTPNESFTSLDVNKVSRSPAAAASSLFTVCVRVYVYVYVCVYMCVCVVGPREHGKEHAK